jgi:hypothetical protein
MHVRVTDPWRTPFLVTRAVPAAGEADVVAAVRRRAAALQQASGAPIAVSGTVPGLPSREAA